jgi:hypothetical protein
VWIIILFIKKKIFRFDISMANSILVQVTKSVKWLLHYTRCLLLCQMLLLSDMVKKFSSLTKFSNQKAYSISFPSLKKFNNIWMVQWPQNTDFVLECLVICYSRFLHRFDCNFLTCQFIFGEVYGSVTTTTKLLFEEVFFFNIANKRFNENCSR